MNVSFESDRLRQALVTDLLVPTTLIADDVLRHLDAVSALQPQTDELDQLMFEVRQALRRYESARALTIFSMGVSCRTEQAKSDLLQRLDRIRSSMGENR